MISDEQKVLNKQKFIGLLTSTGLDVSNLIMYLDSPRVDYFNKAYSTYTEHAYSGSLCEHALLVYDTLVNECNIKCPNRYSNTDIIIVALLKDIYRAELYESYNKNVKNDITGQWESQVSYRVKEVRPIFGDIGFSSFMIAKKFLDISDELAEAICYSGLGTNNIEINNIRKDYPMTVLVTISELIVNYLKE